MRPQRMMKNPSIRIYLMELIIVVAGITIAFQANVWYESKKNAVLELNAVTNLHKELAINMDEFKSLESYRSNINEANRTLLKLLDDGNVTKENLKPLIMRVFRTSTPDLQSSASDFYVSSNYGEKNLFLKSELLVLDTYIQELMEMSADYKRQKELFYENKEFLSSLDFTNRNLVDLAYFKSLHFKNSIWLIASGDLELNRLYDQAYSQLKKVYSMTEEIIDDK